MFSRSHAVIRALLPVSGLSIALIDPIDQHVQMAYQSEDSVAPAASLIPLLCQEVARTAQPLLLTPATPAVLPAPLRALTRRMSGSALAVPLMAQQGVIGVLALHNGKDGWQWLCRPRTRLGAVTTRGEPTDRFD